MDDVAIVTVLACAVVGAALGWGLVSNVNSLLLKACVIFLTIAASAGAGWQWAVPWVEEEWFFRATGSNQSRLLLAVAPSEATTIKERLRRAYAEGRTLAAMDQEGVRWLEEHAQARNPLVLLRLADNTMPVRTYEQLAPLVKVAHDHDPVACYLWFSGTGHPTAEQLGFSQDQQAIALSIANRVDAVVVARLPAALPLADEGPGAQDLMKQLSARWDVRRFDADAIDHPRADLSDERKANGCYTMNAILSEIQRFEPAYRRYMINKTFIPALNPVFAAPPTESGLRR